MPLSLARYRFGTHELDPATQRLMRQGKPLKLPARALELLQLLIEHRHRVVSKTELQELMSTRRELDKPGLMRLVNLLRRMLGESAIATIPGRGWRFVPTLDGDPMGDLQLQVRQLAPTPAEPMDGLPRPALRPLLGREADLAVLGALLSERRLISVVGREGVGKTQLVAHALAHRPGVAWVDLSRWRRWVPPVGPAGSDRTAVDAVARLVAHALGSRHLTDAPLADLCHALRLLEPPGLWLVLDQTTQSALPRDDVAEVVQKLLAAAAPLHVLLVSTQPLALAGEAVHRLLPLPPPAANADARAARQSSAMRLLLAQARRVDRSYTLELRDTPACAAACALVQWLEGVPMALELAGARLPELGPERLLQELIHHRDGLPAGATQLRASVLRLMMDWTLRRCTDAELTLLHQLHRHTEDRDGLDAPSTSSWLSGPSLDLLDALIDAAIVQLESAAPAAPDRYHLLSAWRHGLAMREQAQGVGEGS